MLLELKLDLTPKKVFMKCFFKKWKYSEWQNVIFLTTWSEKMLLGGFPKLVI